MSWLWIAGPALAALVFLLTDWRDKRREAEIERWRARANEARGKPMKDATALPAALAKALEGAGGGKRIALSELVPKIAYLAFMGGDGAAGSDHQTVVAKLDAAAPTFTVRPLPILDGQREANTGVSFKKDTEFMELFIVDRSLEGGESSKPASEAEDKAIRKWLSPTVREALMEQPDLWLRVSGKSMAITLYGPADADRINELVTAADVVFAEYGAEGGPSLFGNEDEEDGKAEAAPPPKKAASKKPSSGKAV